MPSRYPAQKVDPSPLSQPLAFSFSGRVAPNRFLKSAMTERLASWLDELPPEDNGIPLPELVNLYKRWGEGQFGTIVTGNLMIDAAYLESPGNSILTIGSPFSGKRFDAYAGIARQSKAHGSLVLAQINHLGRQCSFHPDPVSASDVQLVKNDLGSSFAKPHAASYEEIAVIREQFVFSAEYLQAAGFDGVQVHAAHGYLLAQFLSPTTNIRTDEYGGSLENRVRLLVEIAREIKKRCRPDFILSTKINSTEFQNSGFQANEAAIVCEMLEREGFDFVELSGGTYEEFAWKHQRESSRAREAFFVEFADVIAPRLSKTKVYLTGGFRTVGGMVNALRSVDGVGLARSVTQEPFACRDVLQGKTYGFIQQRLDQDNYGLTLMLSGVQMRQIGRDEEPVNGSDQDEVDAFMRALTASMEQAQKGHAVPGYFDIPEIPNRPLIKS